MSLDADDFWPDGDGPENPTAEDVIARIKEIENRHTFAVNFGFAPRVYVDGELVW